MNQHRSGRIFILIVLVLVILMAVPMLILWWPVGNKTEKTWSINAESTPNPMDTVFAAASGTAAALLIPTATLPPDMQYWVPPSADGFLPRFTYASTQWALVDASTLASLQTSGCTLRRAGGRALGPGWATEQGAFAAGGVSFVTVLAKYQGTPQFITYSAPNGAVFEIASASASGFAKCQQDGESVLKSLSLQ